MEKKRRGKHSKRETARKKKPTKPSSCPAEQEKTIDAKKNRTVGWFRKKTESANERKCRKKKKSFTVRNKELRQGADNWLDQNTGPMHNTS